MKALRPALQDKQFSPVYYLYGEDEYLKEDAQILGLPAAVPMAKVFDFTLQREVNRELGAK